MISSEISLVPLLWSLRKSSVFSLFEEHCLTEDGQAVAHCERSIMDDRERELWVNYRALPSIENRNALMELYLPYVRYLAERLASQLPATSPLDVDDLAAEAIPALIERLESFDLERRLQFATYAHKRLTGAMYDALRAFDWVPRLERQRSKSDPAHPIVKVFRMATVKKDEGEHFLPDIPEYSVPCAKEERSQWDDDQWWVEVCQGLDRTDRLVLLMYFRERLTMAEIGKHIGARESRVSQRMKSIKERLRKRRNVQLLQFE